MSDAIRPRQVMVWDPYVRISHWMVALLVLGSFLTSESEQHRLVPIHAMIGLTIAALVVLRVVWGFVGSTSARFSAFVRAPRDVVAYARTLVEGRPPLHLSHNPIGGVMVVALLATLLCCAATGAAVYLGPRFHGSLTGLLSKPVARAIKEVHEGFSGVLLTLVSLHVAGVLFSSWREGQNLVRSMIDGRKRAPAVTASKEVP